MGRIKDWLFGTPPVEEETRSITGLPWGTSAPFNIGPGRYDTETDALSLWCVYAAVSLLSATISTLPVCAYRKNGDTRVEMPTPPQLFAQLQADGRLVPWLHRAVVSLALRGNAYGWILARDGFGYATQIEWLDPTEVYPDDEDGTAWRYRGRLIPGPDMKHIPWFTIPGKREGLSPVGAYAVTVGIGLGAQAYAEGFFDNGGFPPGTFQNTEMAIPNADEAAAIRAKLWASVRSGQPLVYGKDWKYDAISIPPEEAQFIQTQKMTATQIAAIYHIPPEKIGGETGHSLTYATTEQHQIEWATDALRTWLVTLETAFSSWLPDKQYVKFNIDGLVRADIKTRYESYAIGLTNGWLSVNEVRALEDLEPITAGDSYGPTTIPAIQAPPDMSGDVVPMRRPGT